MYELSWFVESCELRLGDAYAVDDRVGVCEQDHSRRREGDGARSARPVDQALARETLERRDLMTDRRLHVPKTKRGTPEGAFLRDRPQRDEVPELDA